MHRDQRMPVASIPHSAFRIPHCATRLAIIAVALLVGAGPQLESGADPEANRRYLQELRGSDPEQYARLVRNFEKFRALPPEQQEKLRQLDRQFQEEDSATQARLLRVLGEYGAWLTRLPESDRQRVQSAATAEERLKVVRQIKEQQWFDHLPLSQREQWKSAPEAERRNLVERWKQEERSKREELAEARHWEAIAQDRPATAQMNPETFRKELQTFVEKRLLPVLTPEEKQKLRPSDGRRGAPWLWMRTVAELADRHQIYLALEPKYAKKSELPAEYQRAIERNRFAGFLQRDEGKWPDYPLAVTRFLRMGPVKMTTQLGPTSAKDISPEVERFVNSLPAEDRDKLKKAEGKWPDYPQALHEAAKKNKLAIPELDLPGDPQMWERIRKTQPARMPEPPEFLLRQFALELNKSGDGPRLSLADPHDRQIIIKKFLDKHPEWRRQLEQQDRGKMERKGPRP